METLSWELQDGIGTLTFKRPEALNAINTKMISEVSDWLLEIESNKSIRAVILTGAGEKAFIAGADIKEMAAFGPTEAEAFSEKGHTILLGMRALRVPVIAAVNGFALGGGCEMAMACDFIFAADSGSFGLPEVTLGLMPGFGGTQRLANFVGVANAAEMIFTGKRITATEAKDLGLVNKVFPKAELLSSVKNIAKEISSRGPAAIAMAKKVLAEGFHLSLKDSLKLEKDGFGKLFSTKDMKEGTQAFVEKRAPKFIGE